MLEDHHEVAHVDLSLSKRDICFSVALGNISASRRKSLVLEITARSRSGARRAGRLQFLAVGGYASSVPGVDREDCLVDRRLADLLPGTGDTWNTSEQQTLQKIASEYAYKFNLVIKADLERNNIPLKCFK